MKKSIKIILIILVFLISALLIDTLQAKLFNNRPIFKITKDYNEENVYQKDKGIFVYTYIYKDGSKKTVFKWEKYAPLLKKVDSNNKNNNPDKQVIWEEITAEGVNEELLLKNVDTKLLTQIAAELQTLVDEEKEEERKNPEIVITEGWTRVFKSQRYKKVLSMGNKAMKPLYLIIYKSPNAGMYEYICANILYELSGFQFEWANSKEFLEKFNKHILENK